MKNNKITTAFTFFLIALTLQAQNTLKYNLEEGAVFKVKQQANQLITQKLEGTNHEMTNDLTGLYDFKVVGVDENGFDLILTFQDFALKSDSSIQGVLMDVKATVLKKGDIMSEMFHSLIGHELAMRMNTNGSVVSVEGGDELITKMISAAGIEDEFTTNLMRKSLEKEFSSNGLAKSFEQMTFFYPDSDVAIGGTWENTYNGKLIANNTFTLEKTENNTTSITGKAAIVMNTDESGTIMSLSGSQESAIQANSLTGFIQKIMISSLAEGSTRMSQMGNVEIPTTIKSTITYELLEN
ncbi:DUF6263 family protein [uncultured Croceitalea sp.]|uniref:DUF6263 family protein n=1 Tax=uncultured Croceitalea sp. TaxID=1798908 RepID=UPI00374EC8C9